jgi:xylulose-5-phosphate/fructose-6-phosphate phosphoketolase
MQKFFKQFSFPGGIGSHCTPETPGSIHEGGELGYSLSHGFGAAFDNPDLIVTVVVGDGEAETGPLATSWHSNKFLNPVTDGAVLPILHLNGYKIANPTILARIRRGAGSSSAATAGRRTSSKATTPPSCTRRWPPSGAVHPRDPRHPAEARSRRPALPERPRWPMIILRTPPRAGPPRRRSTATSSKAPGARTRCRSSIRSPTPRTCKLLERGCAATSPKSSSTRTAR